MNHASLCLVDTVTSVLKNAVTCCRIEAPP